jgi:two-component system alkaline phosphatase synthesis response regulator PhoP
VEIARDGEIAVRRGRDAQWDVILLDVMLPHRDGFDVCRTLRSARVRAPIIMLTAKTQEAEKILGLEVGADDYVTKPFSPNELRARIKAVTRRFEDDASGGLYRFGDCEVDFDRAEVRRNGQPADLTALEFRLLGLFIRRRGRVLTRDQLMSQVWGEDVHIGDRVIDTHILNLRKKVEPVPVEPRFVVSVRGLGYRFDG